MTRALSFDDIEQELADHVELRFGEHLTIQAPAFISARKLRDLRHKVAHMKSNPEEALDIAIELLGELVGPENSELIADLVDAKRLVDVVLQILRVYGLGEASGSSKPSSGTGASSNPTSLASTSSTSGEPASDPTSTGSTPAVSPV